MQSHCVVHGQGTHVHMSVFATTVGCYMEEPKGAHTSGSFQRLGGRVLKNIARGGPQGCTLDRSGTKN